MNANGMWCVEFHGGICMHCARARQGLRGLANSHVVHLVCAGETAESRGAVAVGGDDSASMYVDLQADDRF